MFDSGDHSQFVQLFIVPRLGLSGRNIANGLEEAAVVEPVHPFERGEFHCFCIPPRATTVDDLGLDMAGVTGSIPVAPTSFFNRLAAFRRSLKSS